MFQEMWGLFFVQASAQLLNFQIVQQTTPRELHFNQNAPGYGPILRLGRWVKNPATEKIDFVLADLEVGRLLEQSRLEERFEQNEYPVLIERENDRLLSQPFRSPIWELCVIA